MLYETDCWTEKLQQKNKIKMGLEMISLEKK